MLGGAGLVVGLRPWCVVGGAFILEKRWQATALP